MLASGSCAVSKAGRARCTNVLYAFSFLSTLTASTTTPESFIVAANWFRDGISWTHGGHQVAQKFSTNTLPPKSDTETVRPLSVVIEKLGALSPTLITRSSNVSLITQRKTTEATTRRI